MTKIKLSEAKPGTDATIIKIQGGRGMSTQLAGMGLHAGFQINVIEPPQGGNGAMLIRIGDARLMLGHGMAENIIVRQS